MKFGIGMYSTQKPPDSVRPHRELHEDMLRQARLADKVGLDSFWIAEHHFAEDGYAAAVIPICTAILGATQLLTAGTSIAIASFYNPIRLHSSLDNLPSRSAQLARVRNQSSTAFTGSSRPVSLKIS